jgi:uncharacterized protein (DUF1015 family)
MSKTIPLCLAHANPGLAGKVACPPYDVLSPAEARDYAIDNISSFLHITRAEIDLPSSTRQYDDSVYTKAASNFDAFIKGGWLTRDESAFLVYRISYKDHVQTGIAFGASVDEYESGKIKQHELTQEDCVADRMRHAIAIGAYAEPVLLAYRESAALREVMDAATKGNPLMDVVMQDGVKHTIWRTQGAAKVAHIMEKLGSLYIADGHHLCAAAGRVRDFMRRQNTGHTGLEPYNYFPAVAFPDDELNVYKRNFHGPIELRPKASMTLTEIMDLADRKGIMPPKSTWFWPKLASGLFVHLLR